MRPFVVVAGYTSPVLLVATIKKLPVDKLSVLSQLFLVEILLRQVVNIATKDSLSRAQTNLLDTKFDLEFTSILSFRHDMSLFPNDTLLTSSQLMRHVFVVMCAMVLSANHSNVTSNKLLFAIT